MWRPDKTVEQHGPVPSASSFWLPQKSTFIKLASIRAAEKVEEKSFGSSHVMQVIYTDDVGRAQTVYLQCKVWPVEGALGRRLQFLGSECGFSPPLPLCPLLATLGTAGCVYILSCGLMPRCVVHVCHWASICRYVCG